MQFFPSAALLRRDLFGYVDAHINEKIASGLLNQAVVICRTRASTGFSFGAWVIPYALHVKFHALLVR